MSASAAIMGTDPERTSVEESGPTTLRDTGGPGRGSVIAGKYRLEMLLGEGGMACVWSAYNIELELPVAIKLLRSGLSHDRLAERLRHEARAAARLVHPSIVRVFDVAATENGEPFIVMELLTGESLAEELCRGPIDCVRAVQLLLPIADALGFAHTHGIVHRDVKPDNVFLSTDSEELQPKLLDFGIAKLTRPTAFPAKLTERGVTLGSPNYMSPEQVRGDDDVDYRTDIWSFCVLLYKAIAGVAPFQATDKIATLAAIVEDEPAPLALVAGVDEELSRLVHWGLAKDPAERPASMRELAHELLSWLRARGVSAAAEITARRTLVPAAVPKAQKREQQTRRIVPLSAQRRSWPLLAAFAALLAAGSLVWTRTSGSATGHAAEAATAPRPRPAAPRNVAVNATPVANSPAPAAAVEIEEPAPTVDAAPGRDRVPAPRARINSRRSDARRDEPASRLPF